MRTETWTSDKGNEEVHHFRDGKPEVYLFGFNRKLLGEALYEYFREMVDGRLKQLEEKRERLED